LKHCDIMIDVLDLDLIFMGSFLVFKNKKLSPMTCKNEAEKEYGGMDISANVP